MKKEVRRDRRNSVPRTRYPLTIKQLLHTPRVYAPDQEIVSEINCDTRTGICLLASIGLHQVWKPSESGPETRWRFWIGIPIGTGMFFRHTHDGRCVAHGQRTALCGANRFHHESR